MKHHALVIVESPSKARTIERYLGKEYRVLASNGHVKDLPQKELGIDVTNNFKASYVVLPEKAKIIKKLKEQSLGAEAIYIATDPDREGEAIAWHISTELNGDSGKIKRVLFNEITASGVKTGMANPREVDSKLVNAQQARRIIDRLVGFEVSEFLWKVLYSGLSAGRVQSVALRLVCERHEEIEAFKPEEYWTLEVTLETKDGAHFSANLHRIGEEKPKLPDEETVSQIMAVIENAIFTVSSVERKEVRRHPFAPFITSTLQQEAASRLRFSPANSMRIAQRLYEGIDTGEGEPTGLITYMRTDSTRIAGEALHSVRNIISTQFGAPYLPDKPRTYAQRKRQVQDAHEAIRPTDPTLHPDRLKGVLKADELKLYDLIWRRFVASQMTSMVLDQTTVNIAAGDDYTFRATGSIVKFDGFRRIYPTRQEKESQILPEEISSGDVLKKIDFDPEQHFTKPPPYYSESSLIKELDSRGIGRPSTFAETISRLYKREYVNKEKGRLIPTEAGLTVNRILVSNLPDIFDFSFTARMEEELDEIESGNQDYLTVLHDFYQPFNTSMESVREKRKEIKSSLVESTEETCEKCGSPMVIKWNRRGQKFLACSGFPDCRNAKSLQSDEEAETVEKPCPKCGGELQIKFGRYGRYVGCGNYPDCRHTEPLSTGITCPKTGCNGELIERTSKKKKVFYGCSNYPECDQVSWYRPLLHHCETCGSHFVEERVTKNKGAFFACPSCKTEYRSLGDETENDESEEHQVES